MKFLAVSALIVAAAAAPVQNAVALPKIDTPVTGPVDVDALPVVGKLPVGNLPVVDKLPVEKLPLNPVPVDKLPVVGGVVKGTKVSVRNVPVDVDLELNTPVVGAVDVDTKKIVNEALGPIGVPKASGTPPDVVIDDPKGGFPLPGLPKLPTIGIPTLSIPTGLPTPTIRPKLPPGVSVLPIGLPTGLPKLPTGLPTGLPKLPELPITTVVPIPSGLPKIPEVHEAAIVPTGLPTILPIPTVRPKLPPGVTILPIPTGLPKILPRAVDLGDLDSLINLSAPTFTIDSNGELVEIKAGGEKVAPIELENADIAI